MKSRTHLRGGGAADPDEVAAAGRCDNAAAVGVAGDPDHAVVACLERPPAPDRRDDAQNVADVVVAMQQKPR